MKNLVMKLILGSFMSKNSNLLIECIKQNVARKLANPIPCQYNRVSNKTGCINRTTLEGNKTRHLSSSDNRTKKKERERSKKRSSKYVMVINVEQIEPLLSNAPVNLVTPEKTPMQKAIRRAFKGTAHLANLLPTGSVLIFQYLSPFLTHKGKCEAPLNKPFTLALLAFCGLSCFVLCFTDSVRDPRGKVRYGFATYRGFWVVDGSMTLSDGEAMQYRARAVDFFHGFLSMVVFAAVALLDSNVLNCFYPRPSDDTKEMLVELPITVGVICSALFIIFPSKRHGVGFPLVSRD